MNIAGRKVVLSGEVSGHSRGTAQAALQEAGAYVQSSMSSSTEVLVVGVKPGPKKLEKAAALGIEVIPWEQALNGSDETYVPPEAVELAQARVVAPQLALGGELPSGSQWLYEIKWDGYRAVSTVIGGKVAMQSRSGRSEYVEQFPKVAAALALLPDCILDGELIVKDPSGASSFETAHTATVGGTEEYVVFDVLEARGNDVRYATLEERRQILHDLLDDEPPIRISPAHDDGEWLLDWVKEQGLEGIVAKRKGSRYVEGSRTEAWIKCKVRLEQEFVVLGWKPGEGNKAGVAGSLLLGVRDGDQWKSCGRVGTGRDFGYWEQFTHLPQIDGCIECDLGNATQADLNGIVWVEPTCIVQIAFQRWTKDHRLWHPSLLGVRTDKDPFDVVRES